MEAAGASAVGVSRDSVSALARFASKHGLTVPLLSDAEGTVTEAYGVWKPKNMYGKQVMGIERTTVVIDRGGIVRKVYPKVKVEGHAEEVLRFLREELPA